MSPAPQQGDGRRRGSRRAQAPATRQGESQPSDGTATPDADWTQWFAGSEDETGPRPANEREKWFLEQRPPHWG